MVELYAVQDVFASGLGRVDILGGGFCRFVWFVDRNGCDGIPEQVIVASVIMPISTLAANRAMVDAAIAGRPAPMIDAEPLRTH
jgi:hypothetical protein